MLLNKPKTPATDMVRTGGICEKRVIMQDVCRANRTLLGNFAVLKSLNPSHMILDGPATWVASPSLFGLL